MVFCTSQSNLTTFDDRLSRLETFLQAQKFSNYKYFLKEKFRQEVDKK